MIDGSGSEDNSKMSTPTTDVNAAILQRDALHAPSANQMHGGSNRAGSMTVSQHTDLVMFGKFRNQSRQIMPIILCALPQDIDINGDDPGLHLITGPGKENHV